MEPGPSWPGSDLSGAEHRGVTMNLRIKTVRVAVVVCAGLVAVGGCQKSKEQIAVDNMNRPGPGLVRIMNMTDVALGLHWKNMVLDEAVAPEQVSLFRPVGSGKQEVELMVGKEVVGKVPLTLGEKELFTVAVFGTTGNFRTWVLTKEQLKPTATKNLEAYFFDEAGKPISGSVEVTNGNDKYTLTDKSGGILVNVGTYEVSSNGLKSAMGSAIEADGAYSLLVVQTSDGSRHAKLVRNTSADKPMAGGMR